MKAIYFLFLYKDLKANWTIRGTLVSGIDRHLPFSHHLPYANFNEKMIHETHSLLKFGDIA
jgi:hypothetical protein